MPEYRVRVSVSVEAYDHDRPYDMLEHSTVSYVVLADNAQQAHGKVAGGFGACSPPS